ncbi:MAG: sulfatase-like hydrolase/transferase, partial [Myxococcota bacterium]
MNQQAAPNSHSPLLLAWLSALGVGAAIVTVHLGNGIGLLVALGQPPHTWFAIQAVLLEMVMVMGVGLVLAPVALVRPRDGGWIVAGAMALIWLALEYWVAVDPAKPLMWLAGPVLGGLFFLGGAELVRRFPRRAPLGLVGLTAVVHVGLIALPEILAASEPDDARVEIPADRPTPREGAPDVLFVVMDTVRAQSSSTYGYARETTPVLTQLADEGLRFAEASAPATWSLPAHASLFTGTFPSVHQCHAETEGLSDDLPTIMETFQQAGYETRCFSANPHISASFGLTRGFDGCDKAWASGEGARQFTFMFRLLDRLGLGGVDDKGGRKVVGNIRDWMAKRGDDARPAFVFVNFLEAHFPFHQLPEEFLTAFQDGPSGRLKHADQLAFGAQMGRILSEAEIAEIREPMIDMYDGGVLYTDALVGEVVDIWRDAGTLDETALVVLADHGEVVGEYGAFGHLSAVVEEDLRVPLVFRYPGRVPEGAVVEHPVSTVGTFATLAELAEVPLPETVQVGSLLGALPDLSDCLPGDVGCAELAVAKAEAVGQPVIAERFEKHMLSGRFAEGEANGKGPLVNPRGRYRT